MSERGGRLARYAPILWTLAFLAAAELALELRAKGRGWETLLFGPPTYAEPPGTSYGPTDAFPFRSRVVAPEKPPGTARVWVASASVAEDTHLPASEVFPALLEAEFAARGLAVQVLNAAGAGLTVPESAQKLRELGPRFAPDVVVVYHASNDVDQLAEWRGAGLAGTGLPGVPGEAAGGGPAWPTRLAESTTLFGIARQQLGTRLSGTKLLLAGLEPEDAAAFGTRVAGLVEDARALGAEAVLCTFATSHTVANADALPGEWRRNLLRHNTELSPVGWLRAFAAFDAQLGHEAESLGLPLADLDAVLTGRAELFRDLTHFRPEGHRVAARALADALEPVLRARAEGDG